MLDMHTLGAGGRALWFTNFHSCRTSSNRATNLFLKKIIHESFISINQKDASEPHHSSELQFSTVSTNKLEQNCDFFHLENFKGHPTKFSFKS